MVMDTGSSAPVGGDQRAQSVYGCQRTEVAVEAPSKGPEDWCFQRCAAKPRPAILPAAPWRALCLHSAMPKPAACLHKHDHSRVGDHTKARQPASCPMAHSEFHLTVPIPAPCLHANGHSIVNSHNHNISCTQWGLDTGGNPTMCPIACFMFELPKLAPCLHTNQHSRVGGQNHSSGCMKRGRQIGDRNHMWEH